MEPHPDLSTFIQPYSQEVQSIFYEIRSIVFQSSEFIHELIYDNYNAVALAYSLSGEMKDAFCHIALYKHHVNLGFNRGSELVIENYPLEGAGKLIRHVKCKIYPIHRKADHSRAINIALNHSIDRNPLLADVKEEGRSVVLSISKNKLRPTY